MSVCDLCHDGYDSSRFGKLMTLRFSGGSIEEGGIVRCLGTHNSCAAHSILIQSVCICLSVQLLIREMPSSASR